MAASENFGKLFIKTISAGGALTICPPFDYCGRRAKMWRKTDGIAAKVCAAPLRRWCYAAKRYIVK